MRRFAFASSAFLAMTLAPSSVQAHEACEFASMHSFGAALRNADFEWGASWHQSEYRASLRVEPRWQARVERRWQRWQRWQAWSADRRWAEVQPVTASVVEADLSTVSVPEPATWLMMLTGFMGLGFLAYRRREETRS
jgi:hypothetical protein